MEGALQDAWALYDRSLERLVSMSDPVNERIRQAFKAGYESARAESRQALGLPLSRDGGQFITVTSDPSLPVPLTRNKYAYIKIPIEDLA